MTPTISRREFVSRAAFALAAMPVSLRRDVAAHAASALRVGIVSPATASERTSARALGIQLGIDEATHAATLFGGSVELVPVEISSLREHRLSAVIGGGNLEDCNALASAADAAGIAFVNTGCPNDTLRGSDCRRTSFHAVPSDAMYRDALSQEHPANAEAVAWDPSLTRFGADTLNERFRARFNRPMDADAWLGWLAVKVLWESSLRTRSTDAKMLMQYMARDGTQFDGHKGRPLSFRQWDHQLRQPVYVVSKDERGATKVLAELPAAGPPDETSRDALDRLGTPATRSACRMSP